MKIIELEKETHIILDKQEETLLVSKNKSIFLNIDINASSKVTFVNINFSGANISQEITINLLKENAQINFFSLEQIALENNRTDLIINHFVPKTKSRQIFRGIYANNAMGDFLGKAIVHKKATFSEIKQDYKALILSDNAKALVKPELEINNNDVSASHGATIGELDKNALFYLASRGLSLNEAKAMLLNGFSEQVLQHVEYQPLREKLSLLAKESIKGITQRLSHV